MGKQSLRDPESKLRHGWQMFNKIRLAYLDELEKDPEVQEAIISSDPRSRFVFNLRASDGTWNPKSVMNMGAMFKTYSPYHRLRYMGKHLPSWGRVDANGNVKLSGTFDTLIMETSTAPLWDPKSNILLLATQDVLDLEDYNFWKSLGEYLDNHSDLMGGNIYRNV